MRHFLQVSAEKFLQTPKRGRFFEKLRVLAKSMIFRVFSRNDALFAEKFMQTPKRGRLFEKLRVLAKSTTFRVFPRNEARFASFC